MKKVILKLEKINFSIRGNVTNRGNVTKNKIFHILKDVSIEIKDRSVVGILGNNGSGKSTLLKIIMGILPHNDGKITNFCKNIKLLTLTSGFDHNLSGRENTIISGMLYGQSKLEIESKINQIHQYSELREYFFMPISTYSTGMLSRLGFAIAITIPTDLLLIDETLSVGDISFRKKTEKSIKDKLDNGMSAILISHSLPQLEALCDEIYILNKGRIINHGESSDMINYYKKHEQSN